MSRPLRIEYSGTWYHAMNCGRRRKKVFTASEDYESFLVVLQETSKGSPGWLSKRMLITSKAQPQKEVVANVVKLPKMKKGRHR